MSRIGRRGAVRGPAGEQLEVLLAIASRSRSRALASRLAASELSLRKLGSAQAVIEALRRERGAPPGGRRQVVFADQRLPPDGISLLAALRRLGLDAPFVLVAPRADQALRNRVAALGGLALSEGALEREDLTSVLHAACCRAPATPSERRQRAERRRHARLPLELWVEQCDPQSAMVYHARSADLGQGGLSLRQGVPERRGKMYYLTFELPSQDLGADPEVEVTGRIVSVRPRGREYHVGMQFLDLPSRARHRIATLEATAS